jgi:glycine/D-amino acid oxidase-like deaminating enzyme
MVHGADRRVRTVSALWGVTVQIALGAGLATRTCGRPVTADALPLLGPVPGVVGLFVAAGHGPYGISLGPASGRIAADAVLGRCAAPDAFRVERSLLRH